MRAIFQQTYYLMIIALIFSSCEKEKNSQENYFIINGSKTIIDNSRLVLLDGYTITGLKEFYLSFYSEGVSIFKDKDGYDSLVYEDNSIKIYYDLFKPEEDLGFSGVYNYSTRNYPYTNDSAYSFTIAAYKNARTTEMQYNI